MSRELDKLGEFLMRNFRDSAISKVHSLIERNNKAPSLQILQEDIASLSTSQKELLKRTCTNAIDTGIHDLLFALQEAGENEEGIKILVDEKDASTLSDGLQGEPYGDDGWISKFSSHG
jgi:hypothetical protein